MGKDLRPQQIDQHTFGPWNILRDPEGIVNLTMDDQLKYNERLMEDYHIVPNNDIIEHKDHPMCECCPSYDKTLYRSTGKLFWLHNRIKETKELIN